MLKRMSSATGHPTLMHTLMQAFIIVVFGISFILSEPIIDDEEDRYVGSTENTRAAIDELNEVLRFLFPIVPHKSHLVWSSRHRGILINQPNAQQLINVKSFQSQQKQQLPQKIGSEYVSTPSSAAALAAAAMAAEGDVPLASRERLLKPHTTGAAVPATLIHLRNGPSLNVESRHQLHRTVSPQGKHGKMDVDSNSGSSSSPSAFRFENDHRNSLEGNFADADAFAGSDSQLKNKIFHLVLHTLKNAKSNRPIDAKIGAARREREQGKLQVTTPSLGKRGPECMRRCIMQGLLHPVQCHSLC